MKIAVTQMLTGSDKKFNLARAAELINQAASQGAKFISVPEVFNFRGKPDEMLASAENISDGESSLLIQKLAKENQVWILAGSIMEKVPGGLPYNTSFLVSPKGNIEAVYRKIHLFDVTLKGQKISESLRSQAGDSPVIAKMDAVTIGMSICYDLRFPELYRTYSGVDIITVPSAFTHLTGEAHFHVLLRARAIENQCFVVAANQAGAGEVKSYGHSMIIDPWGRILAEASADQEEIIYADLDFNEMKSIRERLPALKHRKIE